MKQGSIKSAHWYQFYLHLNMMFTHFKKRLIMTRLQLKHPDFYVIFNIFITKACSCFTSPFRVLLPA